MVEPPGAWGHDVVEPPGAWGHDAVEPPRAWRASGGLGARRGRASRFGHQALGIGALGVGHWPLVGFVAQERGLGPPPWHADGRDVARLGARRGRASGGATWSSLHAWGTACRGAALWMRWQTTAPALGATLMQRWTACMESAAEGKRRSRALFVLLCGGGMAPLLGRRRARATPWRSGRPFLCMRGRGP